MKYFSEVKHALESNECFFYFCLVANRQAVYLVGLKCRRSNSAALHCIAVEARKHGVNGGSRYATRAFATPIFVASATPIFVASATPYFRISATQTAATPKILF